MVKPAHFVDHYHPLLVATEPLSEDSAAAVDLTGWIDHTAAAISCSKVATIAEAIVDFVVGLTFAVANYQALEQHFMRCTSDSSIAIIAAAAVTPTYAVSTYLSFAFQFHSFGISFISPFLLVLFELCFPLYSFPHNCEVLCTFNLEVHTSQTRVFDHQSTNLEFKIASL